MCFRVHRLSELNTKLLFTCKILSFVYLFRIYSPRYRCIFRTVGKVKYRLYAHGSNNFVSKKATQLFELLDQNYDTVPVHWHWCHSATTAAIDQPFTRSFDHSTGNSRVNHRWLNRWLVLPCLSERHTLLTDTGCQHISILLVNMRRTLRRELNRKYSPSWRVRRQAMANKTKRVLRQWTIQTNEHNNKIYSPPPGSSIATDETTNATATVTRATGSRAMFVYGRQRDDPCQVDRSRSRSTALKLKSRKCVGAHSEKHIKRQQDGH